MRLSVLNFDTPDAACQSLRVIAEHIRTGEMQIRMFDIRLEEGRVRVDAESTQAARSRR